MTHNFDVDHIKKPCAFCGQPVSSRNFQAIQQAQFDGVDPATDLTLLKPRSAPVLFIHTICGLPPGREPPVGRSSKRSQPRDVFYVDVGETPPEFIVDYLANVQKRIKEAESEDVFIVPYRSGY